MCSSAPTINSQGSQFTTGGTDNATNSLFDLGGTSKSSQAMYPGLNSSQIGALMMQNWMTGGSPAPVDPTVKIAETEHLSGVHQMAASGSGYGGAFGKMGGQNFMSPNQPNTPAAPLPTLPPLGRGR